MQCYEQKKRVSLLQAYLWIQFKRVEKSEEAFFRSSVMGDLSSGTQMALLLAVRLAMLKKTPSAEPCACLGQYWTIFQAEIYRILAFAKVGIGRRYYDIRIVIFSDYQAALKALDSKEMELSNINSSTLLLVCQTSVSVN